MHLYCYLGGSRVQKKKSGRPGGVLNGLRLMNGLFDFAYFLSLRLLPYSTSKVVLHGVKSPHQFQALHALYQEPKMQQCVGRSHDDGASTSVADLPSSKDETENEIAKEVHRFSEAQQPPIRNIEGYVHTPHGQKHANKLLSRAPPDLRSFLMLPTASSSSQHISGPVKNGSGGSYGDNTSRRSREHNKDSNDDGNETSESLLPVLGASPWDDWPVFEPNDCNAGSEKVETAWDRHAAKLGQPGAYSQTNLPQDSHLAL